MSETEQDAVSLSKTVYAKVGATLATLMNDLVPEIRPIVDKIPELQHIADADQRNGAAQIIGGKVIAVMIVSAILAELRGHGCPEEMLEQVIKDGQAHERANSVSVTQ